MKYLKLIIWFFRTYKIRISFDISILRVSENDEFEIVFNAAMSDDLEDTEFFLLKIIERKSKQQKTLSFNIKTKTIKLI